MDDTPRPSMDDDLPCPECDGWMRLDGNRWACPACGHRSEEILDEPEPASPVPGPTAAELAVQQGVATSSPSYRRPAGRPRSFGMVFLLAIVTLGIYIAYWRWKVFRELHDQEGTRSFSAFMWLGYALAAVTIGWRLSQSDIFGSSGVSGGGLAGHVLGFAAAMAFLVYLILETQALDAALKALGKPGSAALFWIIAAASFSTIGDGVHGGAAIAFAVIGFLLDVTGTYLQQDGLNRYWEAIQTSPAPPAPEAPTGLTPVAS